MTNSLTVEMRLNNTVFKCVLEQKFYNITQRKPYALMTIDGLLPTGQDKMGINLVTIIICELCWKSNKENEKGLELKEPSQIVVPTSPLPSLKRN
ncbi:MAG TPA: hypothetical protein VE090_02525 [Methylomirabilota bacterium]|nr:hypothetical protein [Methylomirabilota bacterium]